jgi:hypothetical protein
MGWEGRGEVDVMGKVEARERLWGKWKRDDGATRLRIMIHTRYFRDRIIHTPV